MNKKLVIVFLLALVLRILLVFSAYHGDLNNNISWGVLANKDGLKGFYETRDDELPNQIGAEGCSSIENCKVGWPYSAPNQPPLSILMFTGSSAVWQTVENISWWLNNNIKIFPSSFIWFWESKGMVLLIKLPSIIADLGIGWIIYHYIIHKFMVKKKALLIAFVWLFNPITWYNSSIWGQTDSVVNLLGLIAVFALLERKMVVSFMFLVLSLLFKGSLTIFIPIHGLVAILQKNSFGMWFKAVVCSLLTVVLFSIWFHPQLDLLSWLINLYKERILPGEIGFLTANAFNFWWLVDSGKVPDSTLFMGLPARLWGILITLVGISGVGFRLLKRHPELSRRTQNDKRIFLSLCIVSLITFLFMTRIHERYLYPFFPYATISLAFVPQLIIPYVILSATHLLNLYHLFWAPPLGPLENLFSTDWFRQLISVINISIFFYILRLLRRVKI